MSRPTFYLSVAFALAAVACETPAEAPVAEMPPTTAPTVAAAPGAGVPFGPTHGSIGFIGSKITGKHEGKFLRFSGTLDTASGKLEASKVTVEIDVASVQTDTPKLDEHLKSPDFFDAAAHPKATFVSTAIVPGAGGAPATVTGDLTLHGVTKSVSFPATIGMGAQEITVQAEFAINRKDFGIQYPGMPDDLIKDEVVIKLDLKTPASGA